MSKPEPVPSILLALLGPAGTYSDFALQQYEKIYHLTCRKYYCSTIKDIFAALMAGKAEQGIVPFENVIQGPVIETIQELKKHPWEIIDTFSMDIQHVLVTLPPRDQKDITIIASHPQALGQCSKYIRQYFPDLKTANYPSTMAALEKMLASPAQPMAVIIPQSIALKNPALKILATHLHPQENRTTFLVLKKGSF